MEDTKEKGCAGESKRSIGASVMNSHKEKLSSVSCTVSLTYGGLLHHSLEAQGLSWMALPSPTQSSILQKMGYSQTPGSENHVPQ